MHFGAVDRAHVSLYIPFCSCQRWMHEK